MVPDISMLKIQSSNVHVKQAQAACFYHFIKEKNGGIVLSKFENEIERFVADYYKDHDEAKAKLDKWAAENEKGLSELDKKTREFEKELEVRMEKLDGWFAKKQNELDKNFNG
jgi:hypothetical protein